MNHILERLHEFRSSHSQLQSVIVESLIHIISNQEAQMALIDDIKAKQAQTLTELQSDDSLISSLATALNSQTATIAALNTQLAAALANDDTASLQDVSNAMDTLVSEANSQNAALVSAVTANTTSPAGSAGNNSPTQTASPANASPVITSITPDTGTPGDIVTINGQNFVASESVTFGGVAVSAIDMNINGDGTQVQVKVPAGSGQTQVMVANSVGTSNSVPFAFGVSNATPAAPTNAPVDNSDPNIAASNGQNPNLAPADQQNSLSNTVPIGTGGTTADTTKDDGTDVQGTPA